MKSEKKICVNLEWENIWVYILLNFEKGKINIREGNEKESKFSLVFSIYNKVLVKYLYINGLTISNVKSLYD